MDFSSDRLLISETRTPEQARSSTTRVPFLLHNNRLPREQNDRSTSREKRSEIARAYAGDRETDLSSLKFYRKRRLVANVDGRRDEYRNSDSDVSVVLGKVYHGNQVEQLLRPTERPGVKTVRLNSSNTSSNVAHVCK